MATEIILRDYLKEDGDHRMGITKKMERNEQGHC